VDLSTRRRIAFVCALVFGCCLVATTAAAGSEAPKVGCYACIVVDDHGATLWGRREHSPLPNASTTKMVTALAVRASGLSLAEEVRVSERAAGTSGGKLSLIAGERMSVEELLYALLLNSSNDAAVALAESVGGNEAAFVRGMNELASDLGATSSRFRTSHGLDVPGHETTAFDLVLIADAVLVDPVLARIVGTEAHVIETSERSVALQNTNLLLESYPGAVGVKTGYTALAGNVLVAAAERHGRRLITVAMRSEEVFEDSRVLLNHGFRELRRTILVAEEQPVGAVIFDAGATAVVAGNTIRGPHDPAELEVLFEPGVGAVLPVHPGEAVGELAVAGVSGAIATVPAHASTGVPGTAPSWVSGVLSSLVRAAAAVVPGEAGA